MVNYLKKSRREYRLAIRRPKKYQKKLEDLSDYLNLKKSSRFKTDLIPKYWSGQLNNKGNIILFGLNPGLSSKAQFSDRELKKSWKAYKKLREDNFLGMETKKGLGPYYRDYYKLMCGLFGFKYNKKIDWEFFHNNLLNLNLFPYHSNQTNLPGRFSAGQLSLVMERLDDILEFARTQKPKLCIFNGNAWKILFIEHHLVKKPKKITIINDFCMYFFKYKAMSCVLFNHFLSSSRHDGVNDEFLMKTIPKKIKNQYPKKFRKFKDYT